MGQKIYFMALGGGQRVGASCYYLRLGEVNILLDAGMGKEQGVSFSPNFHALMTSPFIQSMSQLNQIFISHAHQDHVGYLLNTMVQASNAKVFMTDTTKMLSEFQLYDRKYLGQKEKLNEESMAAKRLFDRITTVGFMKKLDMNGYKVTFYPAGHIPGAMMVLLETKKHKILYTGDYSLSPTLLTGACMLPEDLKIDILIMCGLHAKHPGYMKQENLLFKEANKVLHQAEFGKKPVLCEVSQLSKGIEFLKCLNRINFSKVPIYLDNSVMNVVRKMEGLSIPILTENNKIKGERIPKEKHIYLSSQPDQRNSYYYEKIRVDFSLHEDFLDMKEFLKKLNPKQAVMVHCGKETTDEGYTIEQEMMLDSDCRTQFIFAEEKEIYQLG